MKFKHIIWDYDGTLFDSYPAMATAFCDVLKEYDIMEPIDKVISHMKVSMGDARDHYTEKYKLDDVFFRRYNELREIIEAEHTKPFDGITELCHSIFEHGGKNYLFTHRGESALYFLDKFGIDIYFTECITAAQNFSRKPSPEAIIYLVNKHCFSNDEALMIGDRDIDIMSGKNAGICTCYFANGNKHSSKSDFNIDYFSELSKILEIN